MLINHIKSQFGNPTGFLGSLVGWTMAKGNRTRVEWAVEMLNPQSNDQILEIGSGPGVSLSLIAKKLTNGAITGLDISKTMLRQARRRSRSYIKDGHVRLFHGSVADLGFELNYFDKVLAINSMHHWGKPLINKLNKLRLALKSGGTIHIFEQPRWAQNESEVNQAIDRIKKDLASAGFVDLSVFTQPMQPVTCIYVRGRKI